MYLWKILIPQTGLSTKLIEDIFLGFSPNFVILPEILKQYHEINDVYGSSFTKEEVKQYLIPCNTQDIQDIAKELYLLTKSKIIYWKVSDFVSFYPEEY